MTAKISSNMRTPQTGKRLTFLITAGPTVEDIDPVRFLSNRATGKLGFAVAKAAAAAGHRVILVHGPVAADVLQSAPHSAHALLVPVRSAAQMHRAVMARVKLADVVVMNAAVADFTPQAVSPIKIKKSKCKVILRLKPTVDILKELGRLKERRPALTLLGFALETGKGKTAEQRHSSRLAEARRKLRQKNLDAIVLDTPDSMGATRGDFTVLGADESLRDFHDVSKQEFANVVVGLAAALCGRR